MVPTLAAFFLALVLAGPAAAQDLKPVKVTQAVASFAFLPIDYAKAAGYFEDEGLDVQQIAAAAVRTLRR
jgi:ABC-type nitrate/sulfonate/bicarbonate transport system substrate-binding protein